MMETQDVLALAARAKEAGADRFCMGAAWRNVRDGEAFDSGARYGAWRSRAWDGGRVTLGMLTHTRHSG